MKYKDTANIGFTFVLLPCDIVAAPASRTADNADSDVDGDSGNDGDDDDDDDVDGDINGDDNDMFFQRRFHVIQTPMKVFFQVYSQQFYQVTMPVEK
ncbi:hypothetical protein PoB_004999200 [Plakobranchus ocellatus]|uniref:Uncharacterized protein n=1 Tax=Plakobranchus ocellatus TaxID=259542 RepID=A0AAV4BVX6_9GAST|nr:hypothetical protein PoB_004999200 [Plakobranchus ocellatus]